LDHIWRSARTKPREWWKLSNAQLDDEVDDDIEDAEMGYEIALSTVSNAEPLSYAEALRRPDAEQWKHAALEELNAQDVPECPEHLYILLGWALWYSIQSSMGRVLERSSLLESYMYQTSGIIYYLSYT
jgi:hypothetical protein